MKLIEKRLSLFWAPWIFLLPEWGRWLARTIDFSTYYDLKTYIKINEWEPFGLFFTPNWELWKINHIWEKVKHAAKDAKLYMSSLYVDLDMRDSSYSDIKKYKAYLIDTLWKDKFKAQYVVQTWNWFHVYAFIKEEERYKCWELFKSDFATLQKWIAASFDWWDPRSHSISKLMRMPFGKYWKTWQAIDTKLYKVIWSDTWVVLDEVIAEKDIVLDKDKCVGVQDIAVFLENLKPVVMQNKGQWKKILHDAGSEQINSISLQDVLGKLHKYPRIFQWKKYIFRISWSRISFDIDWTRYYPDWYKLNINKNYINNFSFDEHNIDERPRWGTFVFLYRYFNKDMSKIDEFLKEEYWFSFTLTDSDWTYLSLTTDTWLIYFTDKWVFYHTTEVKWKNIEDVKLKLFDTPLVVKWVIKTNYDMLWESEDKVIYYIIKNMEDDSEIIIEFTEDRKRFNRKYWRKWFMFMAWEFQMLDFFMAINNAVKTWALKEYDFRYINWYYPDYYIMWDNVIDKNYNFVDTKEIDMILKTQEVLMEQQVDEVSLSSFWDKLTWIFSNRQAMLSFVTFITLMLWHKFRWPVMQKYKQQVLLPGLFLSWDTRTGKTTLMTILKNWARIATDTKKYSIKSTTPQPLKQASTDDFILHLEEFTWHIGEVKETIVRDILNKAKTARWQADWDNVYYIFRSSLILDGEKLPESQSVSNRCVVVPMFEEDKIWTESKLWWFVWKSFLWDFIKQTYDIEVETIIKQFKSVEAVLRGEWIRDRNLLIYSFLLLTNRLYNIFLEPELIDAIKENLQLHSSIDKHNNILSDLLAELIITNRISPTLVMEQDIYKIIVPFTMEIKNRNKVILMNIQKKYPGKIQTLWNNIIITLNPKDSSEDNKELYNIVILFKRYFKNERLLELE